MNNKKFKLISENEVECPWCGLVIETGVFNIGQHISDCPVRRKAILQTQHEIRRRLNQNLEK